MKEYICKGCVHEKNCTELKCDGVAGCKFYITKTDICREFWAKVLIQGRKTRHNVHICVDNVLAEMEDE